VDDALPNHARAAVADRPGSIRLRTFPLPATGEDDGLLRVEATGVCDADWEIYHRGPGGAILGHEIVGRVAALGSRAARRWGVAAGDRVVVEEFLPCGSCRSCRRGDYARCRPAGASGGAAPLRYGRTPVTAGPALYGGFSEFLYLHPRSVVHRIGEDVDARTATLFAPLSGALRWLTGPAATRPGDTVVVLGTGRQGLACVPAARHAGAGTVIVAGPAREWQRLHVAKHLGADHVVFAGEEDVVAEVRELTAGRGADTVLHLDPEAGSVRQAVATAAPRATVVLAARPTGGTGADLPYDDVVARELRLTGAGGHDHRCVPAALDIIRSRHYPLHLLTTHHFAVAEADAALRTAAGRTGEHAIHISVGA
jgi:threonine dehydrogenase-like Zn-dependent dehydrogenase